MKVAVGEGKPVTLKAASTIADGIAVRRAGDRTLPLVQKYVDDIVTVEEEEIANAILLLLEREKTMAEGAGAAAIAAMVDEIVARNPDKVAQAKAKPAMVGWFVGQVMKASGGKANPSAVNDLLKRKLEI